MKPAPFRPFLRQVVSLMPTSQVASHCSLPERLFRTTRSHQLFDAVSRSFPDAGCEEDAMMPERVGALISSGIQSRFLFYPPPSVCRSSATVGSSCEYWPADILLLQSPHPLCTSPAWLIPKTLIHFRPSRHLQRREVASQWSREAQQHFLSIVGRALKVLTIYPQAGCQNRWYAG